MFGLSWNSFFFFFQGSTIMKLSTPAQTVVTAQIVATAQTVGTAQTVATSLDEEDTEEEFDSQDEGVGDFVTGLGNLDDQILNFGQSEVCHQLDIKGQIENGHHGGVPETSEAIFQINIPDLECETRSNAQEIPSVSDDLLDLDLSFEVKVTDVQTGEVVVLQTRRRRSASIAGLSVEIIDEETTAATETNVFDDRIELFVDKSGQVVDETDQVADKIELFVDKSGQVVDEIEILVDESGHVYDQSGQVVVETEQLADKIERSVGESEHTVEHFVEESEEGAAEDETEKLVDGSVQGVESNEIESDGQKSKTPKERDFGNVEKTAENVITAAVKKADSSQNSASQQVILNDVNAYSLGVIPRLYNTTMTIF